MGEDEAKLTDIHMRGEEKLSFLASVVESSDDAIISMTLDGIILCWNLGAKEVYYYSAEEITGKSISILAPPDRTDEIPLLLKKVGQGESIKNFDTVRIRKDGKRIDISLTMSPIKDAIGRIIAISSIARDITERKRLEEEQRREKELSDALNSINTAINSTLDFDEIMRRVVIESMRAINAETSAILLLENNYWILRYFYGKLREQEPELIGIRFTYEQAKAVALAARTAEPVILSDAYNDKRVNTRLAKRYRLRSIINVPLITREEVIGSISFAYHSAPVDFKKAEIDFSRKLATSVSLAIQNVHLFEERKRVEEALKKERDRAQNYLNIAGVMIVVINTDQKVTLVNKKCSEVLGYKEQEIIGRNWFDTFIPERSRDEVRATFMKLIAGEIEPVEYFENPVLTREGEERLIAWHNAVLKDDAGNITATLSSGEDITERRQIEERLREAKELSDALNRINTSINSTLDFDEIMRRIVVEAGKAIDSDACIITLHEDGYRVINYAYGMPQEIIGVRFIDEQIQISMLTVKTKKPLFIKDAYSDERTEAGRQLVEKYDIRSLLIVPLIVRDNVIGALTFIYHSVKPAFNQSEIDFAEKLSASVSFALENARIYAELKQFAQERERWTAELSRSNAELEQFAYIASHDLQEPLRMVSGFTQLLAKRYKDKLDKNADEFIAYIVDGTTRMQRMIEDLLAYSRVGTRGKPFEPANLEDIFNLTVTNLKAIIDENKAQVTHDPLPMVMADATQIVQLFQNLIGNAIKFRKKEEPPRIRIGVQRRGNEWLFSVKDNGIGIAPGFMGHLFQLYQREHPAGEYPGTGIGLAICKRIVERHRGRIWAESEPGKGSTFHFTIPVKRGEKS